MGLPLIKKTISPLENLGTIMILYIVPCGHYPVGVKNRMFAEILV